MSYQLITPVNYIDNFLKARALQNESVSDKLKNALLEKYGEKEKEASIAQTIADSQYKTELSSLLRPKFDLSKLNANLNERRFQEQLLMDPSLKESRAINSKLSPYRTFINSLPSKQKELVLSGNIGALEPAVQNMLSKIQQMTESPADEVVATGSFSPNKQENIPTSNLGKDYSNIIIRKEPLPESTQEGLFGVKRRNVLNENNGKSIPIVLSPERSNELSNKVQVSNLQNQSNLMQNGLDMNGLSHSERMTLAGHIQANDDVVKDDAVKKKLNSAIQIEGLLSDPITRRIVYNSTLYAGAQGKGKAFVDSLKNSKPEMYNDYINYKTILASNLTNLTKQLEQLGATNETRRDINNNFVNSLNMWTSNPEQALTSINEAFREMSILAKNASISAQPLYPFAKEKASGIDLNFVPIKVDDINELKETNQQASDPYKELSDDELERRISELTKAKK
jgi:hypothetical protein